MKELSEYEVAKGISLGISLKNEPLKSLEEFQKVPTKIVEEWKKIPATEKENTFEMLIRKGNILKSKDVEAEKKAEAEKQAAENPEPPKPEKKQSFGGKSEKPKEGDIQ